MTNPVPEKLTSFRVYKDGVDLLGVADVELPDLEYMTESVTGAGIAGEIESPVVGHFKSLVLKLKWRTISANLASLAAPEAHNIDLRGVIQNYDAGSGKYKQVPAKCVVKAVPKKVGLGKMEVGKPQDNESEFEVVYLKLTIDGEDSIEVDKYNYIFVVDGEDRLSDVRSGLGL